MIFDGILHLMEEQFLLGFIIAEQYATNLPIVQLKNRRPGHMFH